MQKWLNYGFTLGILLISLVSCKRTDILVFLKPPKKFSKTKRPTAPNYYKTDHWHKWQPHLTNRAFDVFYIHPTTYIMGKSWNQHLDDDHVNWRTRELPLSYQASLFYEDARMFIPKYRQAVFYSFVDAKGNGEQALDMAYEDVRAAFYHYIEHYNKERPFVLAAHSQGSYHSKRLLAEILQDSIIKAKLVVAYLVGWPVETSYLEAHDYIEVCSTSTQTGCIVSWNTESGKPLVSLVEEFGKGEEILCVNPLSWTLDTTYVSKDENKGALMHNKKTKEDEILLYYCDAQIQDGALKITPPANQRQLQMGMGKGNYHIYDYTFFYQNVKQNVKTRVAAFQRDSLLECTKHD